MTPAELAARCADMRAWWTRWAEAEPGAAQRDRRRCERRGETPRHLDPIVYVRCSDLEQILADAQLLALAVLTLEDLTDDERAAIRRHIYPEQ